MATSNKMERMLLLLMLSEIKALLDGGDSVAAKDKLSRLINALQQSD